jgi:protein-disulfide isomerase-like protein with CxxC motif
MTMPKPIDHRIQVYLRQSGRRQLTPAQRRRVRHKEARIERLTGQRSPTRGPGR